MDSPASQVVKREKPFLTMVAARLPRRANCSAVVSSDLFLIREEFSSPFYAFRAGIAAFDSDFWQIASVLQAASSRELLSSQKRPR